MYVCIYLPFEFYYTFYCNCIVSVAKVVSFQLLLPAIKMMREIHILL